MPTERHQVAAPIATGLSATSYAYSEPSQLEFSKKKSEKKTNPKALPVERLLQPKLHFPTIPV
jgi:hypothetical protein